MRASGLLEYEAVLAVARHRSFRAAATELDISSSALSSNIAAIEARLGVRLFNRTTRSVALTEAGEQFVARIAPALSELRHAADAISQHGQRPSGTLRINCAAGALRIIFTPFVLEYLRRYPDMHVDIVTDGRLIDIVADGFDAGIRLAESVPQDMIAVPFGSDVRFAVVGSPAYFEGRQRPLVPADLAAHRAVRMRLPSGKLYRWEFARRGESATVDVPGMLTLDDMASIRDAALAGVGLAYMSEWQVRDDITAGRLIRVLEDWTPAYPGLCIYYPGRRHVPPGLRAFIELVRESGADFVPRMPAE
ncbi:MAG: LysR substrate-binding domain-containing protein [Rhodocyclaceae bacterium]